MDYSYYYYSGPDLQQIEAFYTNLVNLAEARSNNSIGSADLIRLANQASWTPISSFSDSDDDDFTYEEYLEDEELRRGVNRGLTEDEIMGNLKTRKYGAATKQETEICVICQGEYEKDGEIIGGLHCGHEYHAECIKKWLLQNKSCPICKATAVSRTCLQLLVKETRKLLIQNCYGVFI